MSCVILKIKYTGFTVNVCAWRDGGSKSWVPNTGDYEKNLFFTYLYRGRMHEYRADDGSLSGEMIGEATINTNVHLDYPTKEYYSGDTVWLCFSGYKPYVGEYMRLKGTFTVPVGVGVYNALGSFKFGDKEAKALNYVVPRDYEYEIAGDAKIILLTLGEFVNRPKALNY